MNSPASLRDVARRVGQLLDHELTTETTRWQSLDARLADPFADIRRLASGGKRLRPAFAHWGYVGCGGSDPDEVARVGAAIELLHVMALFHDDIVDGAATRRGEPTAHVRAQQVHESRGWAGESRRHGEGVALLTGDLAYALSDQLFGDGSARARQVWNELRIEVNVGQYLDVVCSASGDRTVETADRICRFKSGKYTVERPLHIGAMLAMPDISDEAVARLSAYGLPLGDAFQMRDDVMGAFGDSAVTGKPVGVDLSEGKPTPLLARAHARATTEQRRVLELVGSARLSSADVTRVQDVIVETGALDEMETLIASLRDQAIAALPLTLLTSDSQRHLEELAHFVTDREK